jgi:hypothetical protein
MKEKGLRILIFSQMSHILDILEDYGLFGQYSVSCAGIAASLIYLLS